MAARAASCIVALFFGGAASAGEVQCWQPYEIEAARVRDLQIMLMLGSLKCRSTNSEITAKYDKFYERMGNADKYNNALKLRFMRENGIATGNVPMTTSSRKWPTVIRMACNRRVSVKWPTR
ncbi:hypothetical protein [Sphingobium fuliginis]|uniref:hypothetical protein n=1 Tax=Sphingobium fuliginis (strain ATCC 27551) TaxID=336203 RepID=UPI0020C82512|nr:hypothetical protein [Sphingobium fuliginis]